MKKQEIVQGKRNLQTTIKVVCVKKCQNCELRKKNQFKLVNAYTK